MDLLTKTWHGQSTKKFLEDIYAGHPWIIDIKESTSIEHYLKYAGRYVRRPPLAEYRFLESEIDQIKFRTKDHKKNREVTTKYKTEDFVRALADQVPEHYTHTIRYFGLLSPHSKHFTSGALFAILGQQRRPKPDHLSWARSIEKSFGVNPLKDARGEQMRLIGRRPPMAS